MQTSLQKNSVTSAPSSGHTSVLLQEVLEGFGITPDSVVVDATIGGAGHMRVFAEKLGAAGVLVGIDADDQAVARAREALADAIPTVHLVQGNFRHIKEHVTSLSIPQVDYVLFDLGWSGYQLESGRGFSFTSDEPLVMTYASADEDVMTAYDLLHTLSKEQLADIIFAYGEERFARRIAERIVTERTVAPITTAAALAQVVKRAVPVWYRHRRTHPATKTFQALRIAVNDELDALRDALAGGLDILAPGGRMALITFHSIEDRIVKRTFERFQQDGKGVVQTRKPIAPSKEEVEQNPRARSAKLRIFEKTI